MWDMMNFSVMVPTFFTKVCYCLVIFFLNWTIPLFCVGHCVENEMVSIANALFLSLVILQQVMCMTLHWKWFGSLTWGDWFQVSSKERTDYYHKKEFGKKKKILSILRVLGNCQSSMRLHQQRTLPWAKSSQSQEWGKLQLPYPLTSVSSQVFSRNNWPVLVTENTAWGHGISKA